MAPNVFHSGVTEKVSVSVFDASQPVTVKLYVQDYPYQQRILSQAQGVVQPGKLFISKKK